MYIHIMLGDYISLHVHGKMLAHKLCTHDSLRKPVVNVESHGIQVLEMRPHWLFHIHCSYS